MHPRKKRLISVTNEKSKLDKSISIKFVICINIKATEVNGSSHIIIILFLSEGKLCFISFIPVISSSLLILSLLGNGMPLTDAASDSIY